MLSDTKTISNNDVERLATVRAKLFTRIDVCMKNLESANSELRINALKTLKRQIAMLTESERDLFKTNHSHQDCYIQQQLFAMLKQSKSNPREKSNQSELLLILDLIQGLALIHYESKQLASRQHRLVVILTFLASKNEALIIATLETLEAIIVDSCENTRVFESNGGLEIVCNLLKERKAFENTV
jgi:hypothetical protein